MIGLFLCGSILEDSLFHFGGNMEEAAKARDECPNEAELKRYHSGKSGRKKEQMKNHVSGCPRCKELIKQWSIGKRPITPSLRALQRNSRLNEQQGGRKKSSLYVRTGGFMKDEALVEY